MSTEAHTPRRRALLIGINLYPNLPERYTLDGCCNDVALMRTVLTGKFGFPADDVRMLQNEQATRDLILEALDRLVDETEQDDIVVIHYAGHGSQMRDRENDEADGMDETIVPHDGGRAPAPNREITDDELHVRLLRLTERTRNVTLIFDCCHSGTIVRDLTASKARQLEADPRPPEALPPSPLTEADRALLADVERGPSGWFPVSGRYVLISGCRDEERSYEHVAEGDTPVAHGALTWFLTDALLRAVPGTTYRDVFEHVSAAVNGANAAQHPQIEGTLERELFGVRDIEPMRFVAVEARAAGAGTVTLAGGAAHGLTSGSRWEIHPHGAKRADAASRLGAVRITSVGAVSSEAAIEEEREPGAITPGARAVETAHDWGEMRLAVRQEGVRDTAPEAWDALAAALGASGLLRVTDAPGPRVRAILLAPRATVGPDDVLPEIGPLGVPAIAVVSEAGELMMAPKPLDEVTRVVENLEQWARFRLKLAIRNEGGSPLDGAVRLELLRRAGNDWAPIEPDDAGGMRVVHVGDTIEIRLTNTTGEPLHVALFDFRPTGEVKRLFPAGRSDPLQPGVPVMLGRGRGFTASWPKGFPFVPNPYVASPVAGTETLKVFVTAQETDFGYLEQASASRDLSAVPGPLHRLLAAAHGGATKRDLDPVPPDDWATAVLPFSLRAQMDARLDTAAPLELTGVSLRAEGVTGNVEVVRRGPPRAPGSAPRPLRLDDVLAEQGMRSVRSFALGTESAPGSRGDEQATVEVDAPEPPEGWGGVVVSVDEAGVVGWHFAEEVSPGRTATRSLPTGRHTFRIPQRIVEPEPAAGAPAHRGLAGMMGRKLLDMFVFPLLDPAFGAVGDWFASRWEERRRPYGIRSFTPDDYRADGTPVGAERWRALAGGRTLMFVHGTFSSARHAFHAMPRETLEKLHAMYDGRVIAFDHPTVSRDPRENVEWLLQRIPSDLRMTLDIVCHSRGGLVSRVLAERAAELTGSGATVDVGRVLFAGAPNAGTALADPQHMGAFLDSYTNLLNFVDLLPDNGVTEILDAIVTVAKQAAVGALGGLDGLQAMRPGGPFEQWLGRAGPGTGARYFAVASDFTPKAPGLREWIADRVMDRVFAGQPNDLVVPTASVYEGEHPPLFPIAERIVLTGDDAVGHSGYFAAPSVRTRMLEWLGGGGVSN